MVATLAFLKLGGLLAAGYAVTRKPGDAGGAGGTREWSESSAAPLAIGLAEVRQAPTAPLRETWDEAKLQTPTLTLDEYTLARIVVSEFGSGTAEELCCIADADYNRAKSEGRSIWWHATMGSGFGAQGEKAGDGGVRPVSTARAPGPRHILAALAVTRGKTRGIARGARRYFDPETQDALSTRDRSRWCPAAVILERWTYNKPWGSTRCSLGPTGSGPGEEWVGPIDGVNARKLMLLRPGTADQDRLFALALDVIRRPGVG